MALIFYKRGASSSKPPTKELSSSIVVLSAIYGIIGGLAITTAIGAYSATIQSLDAEIRTPLDVALLLSHNTKFYFDTVLLLGFFTVALPTYLGSTFFLSHQFDTKEENNGIKVLFLTFILSFLQSVFLYFMSTSIESFNQFVLWLFLLQIVNSIWSIWQLFTRSHVFRKQYRPPPPREWVPIDGRHAAARHLCHLHFNSGYRLRDSRRPPHGHHPDGAGFGDGAGTSQCAWQFSEQ